MKWKLFKPEDFRKDDGTYCNPAIAHEIAEEVMRDWLIQFESGRVLLALMDSGVQTKVEQTYEH